MMVSYAGEEVVAGVGLDTMIYTVFIYLFTSISAGGAIVVSQYLGNKKKENADNAYWTYSDIIEAINDRINHLKNYII